MANRVFPPLVSALAVLLSAGVLPAAEPEGDGADLFEKRIRPVLAERCYECHSAESKKAKGGLLVDSKAALLKGGDTGPAVVPGNADKSLLIQAIRYHDPDLQMPPKKPLTAAQVADFERWVKLGAPDPRLTPGGSVAVKPSYDWAQAKQFWSFRPVVKPAVPSVANTEWGGNPVDAFVAATQAAKNVHPVGLADKRALIRRATYDLTGLPPTPREVEEFVGDTSAGAFAAVVERLLVSPAYGEKWGRHWLDVARYADTSGCNSDFPVPQAAYYRDYVIRSFNADKPYDQFLKEQLAGDLMSPADDQDRRDKIVATGYLAIARRFGSRNNEFHLTFEDVIDNFGKSMLGLSVSCARCHDHKFDPIPTADYYALYGIFNSTKYAFPGTEIYNHTKDFVPLGPPEEAALLRDHETRLAAADDGIEKWKNEKLRASSRLEAARASVASGKPGPDGKAVTEDQIPSFEAKLKEVSAEFDAVKAEATRLEKNPPNVPKAYAVSEGKPANVRVQKKGEPKDLGDEAPRGFLTVLGGQKLAPDDKTSGRLALAGWVADANNPLTARVMVNRIWMNHFGRGIVATPNDFGVRGTPPTHPELLDYLAARFVEGGWSVKAMHRLILSSRAYQLATTDDPANEAIDPANDTLWRQNARRLSAEEIRDTLLVVGDSLDRSPAGTHPFPPEMQWRYTQHKPFYGDYTTNHRSIYLMQQRIRKQPFLAMFDGADTNAATGLRPISTTAIQALFVMNDPLVHETAAKFAARVMAADSDDGQRIEGAYRTAFGRPATPEEVQLGRQYLAAVTEPLKASGVPAAELPAAAWTSYVRAMLGSNEFVFVD